MRRASHKLSRAVCLLLIPLGLFASSHVIAASKRHTQENATIKMVVIPRAPQQMAAFYEGREFPNKAIAATRSACFFTVGIHNKSPHIVRLDTLQWQLISGKRPVALLTKSQWKQRWQKLDVPQRFQSTFRWTLLPQQLDFQPNEHEGGNITIVRQDKPFQLIAHFKTIIGQQQKAIRLTFENLHCAKDEAP